MVMTKKQSEPDNVKRVPVLFSEIPYDAPFVDEYGNKCKKLGDSYANVGRRSGSFQPDTLVYLCGHWAEERIEY